MVPRGGSRTRELLARPSLLRPTTLHAQKEANVALLGGRITEVSTVLRDAAEEFQAAWDKRTLASGAGPPKASFHVCRPQIAQISATAVFPASLSNRPRGRRSIWATSGLEF